MGVQQQDSGAEGRRLAVDALAVLALKHDERAIAAISTCLQDQNGEVRSQAMMTLIKVATNKTEGFEDIIESTLRCLEHWDDTIRQTMVETVPAYLDKKTIKYDRAINL